MNDTTKLPRRRLLQASIASLGLAALTRPGLAKATIVGARMFGPTIARVSPFDAPIIAAARAGLERAGSNVAYRDVVGVADFSQHSAVPRLHLVDMARGGVQTLLVAHGRGSDPERTGWLSRFSNAEGSDATSEGAFVTGDYYIGAHGPSMRLIGLDHTNSNAESRRIVVHAAWYVGPEILRTRGMLGRSEGCFAVSAFDLPTMLTRLGPGHLLVAGRV
jgi:hypothetical protein